MIRNLFLFSTLLGASMINPKPKSYLPVSNITRLHGWNSDQRFIPCFELVTIFLVIKTILKVLFKENIPSWPNFVSKWVGNGQSRVRQCVFCSYISPHWTITTGTRGLFDPSVGIFSTLRTISIPSSITFPNTTCFWSRKSHFVHVMKNWHPFVCLLEFAKTLNWI